MTMNSTTPPMKSTNTGSMILLSAYTEASTSPS
jgi:hypothetical protein